MQIEMLQIPITREERPVLRDLAKRDDFETTKDWVRQCIAYYLIQRYPDEYAHLLPKKAA